MDADNAAEIPKVHANARCSTFSGKWERQLPYQGKNSSQDKLLLATV